ncbi:MAG: DUF2809 domain-containing protein [Sphingobacteriaceae bacterium]|nr:MAG: DUF2809 domain-containing protein [Sphingobacteriaceae bacterium]
MLVFNKQYFLLAVALFITEVIIATFVSDNIVRPYGGDFLVVMLIYTAIKGFINISWLPTVIGVLLLAFVIEGLQYVHFINLLGLANSTMARMMLGDFFAVADLVAYTLGVMVIILIEMKRKRGKGNA